MKATHGSRLRARLSRALLVLTVALSLLHGMALAGETVMRVENTQSTEDTEHAEGGALYRTYCRRCHGVDAVGYAGDNAVALRNQDFLVSVNDEFLKRSIANGRPGTLMAGYARAYGGPLNDSEIDALVSFIRSWQYEPDADITPDPVVGDAIAARSEFAKHCAECHGGEGQGVTAASLNNPEFLAAASDGQIRWAIVYGRRGTPMPAFAPKLPSKTIDDLVALIRSWQY